MGVDIQKVTNIILEPTTTKNKGIVKKDVLHPQYFSQYFHNKS